jgi:hypothetical protein
VPAPGISPHFVAAVRRHVALALAAQWLVRRDRGRVTRARGWWIGATSAPAGISANAEAVAMIRRLVPVASARVLPAGLSMISSSFRGLASCGVIPNTRVSRSGDLACQRGSSFSMGVPSSLTACTRTCQSPGGHGPRTAWSTRGWRSHRRTGSTHRPRPTLPGASERSA